MKKTYIHPSMLAVRIQQMGLICESYLSGLNITDGTDENPIAGYGGDSDNDLGGSGGRAKGFTSIWDDEW